MKCIIVSGWSNGCFTPKQFSNSYRVTQIKMVFFKSFINAMLIQIEFLLHCVIMGACVGPYSLGLSVWAFQFGPFCLNCYDLISQKLTVLSIK